MRKLVDTNVLLRFLTADDPAKASRCESLFRRAAEGREQLYVTDVCLAELVWTLSSYYGLARTEIADKLIAILNSPGFEFTSLRVLVDAADRYRSTNVDYIDAYHAALASDAGMDVCSYDRDFLKFRDVKRVEP